MRDATMFPDQSGIASRSQLRAAGFHDGHVRDRVNAGRWHALSTVVIATHNGPLTTEQREWASVLSAPDPVALCGLSAMRRLGVNGLPTAAVHILVTRGARVVPISGLVIDVHESRRFSRFDILPRLPPVTGLERSTIDAASWSPDVKTAIRVAVAPVQQRLTTAGRLREALSAAGQIRFRHVLAPFIADLEGGAEALSEVAFLRWCRKHGFPKPQCQARQDAQGKRRYLDADFRLPGGAVVRAEIDGGIHLTLATRWADTAKGGSRSCQAQTG